MHICFITHEYPKLGFPHGGIGSFVKTIALELVKLNIKVSIVGINYTNNYEFIQESGVDVYRLKPKKVKGISWFLNSNSINSQIKKINQQHAISIVETSELGLAFLSKISSIRYIIRLHGGHHFFAESENRKINFWKGFQEKRSFKKADSFIAVSEFVKNHTQKFLNFNNKKIGLINYPINTNLFAPIQTKKEDKTIVFVGTVCEKKGIRQLIQAFQIVKNKFPTAVLNIYGRDWFFPDGSSYIKMLKEKELANLDKISKDINFNGLISYEDIPKKYAKAEVCVFPSHMETQGLVAPEAMAMEKMVIFTNLGPGPETIIDFETGFLCNPYDSGDIAEKIIWTFENPSKAIQIGIQARQFVIHKYNINKIVQQNIIFFKSIL